MNEIRIGTDVESPGPVPGPRSMRGFASAAHTAEFNGGQG